MGKKYDVYIDGKNIGTAEEKTFYGADFDGIPERRTNPGEAYMKNIRATLRRQQQEDIQEEALALLKANPEDKESYDKNQTLYKENYKKYREALDNTFRFSFLPKYLFWAAILDIVGAFVIGPTGGIIGNPQLESIAASMVKIFPFLIAAWIATGFFHIIYININKHKYEKWESLYLNHASLAQKALDKYIHQVEYSYKKRGLTIYEEED